MQKPDLKIYTQNLLTISKFLAKNLELQILTTSRKLTLNVCKQNSTRTN